MQFDGRARSLSTDDSDDNDSRPWWIFVIIPIIFGLVIYLTNVVALTLTFYPIEFKGWRVWQPEGQPFGFFGWQGIMPLKVHKVAGGLTDMITTRLINVKKVFARINPEIVKEQCESGSETVIFIFLDSVWVLPVTGFVFGLLINILATRLIFWPIEPHRVLGVNFQGVFLKRQKAAALAIATWSEKLFLRPRHIIGEILNGKLKDAFYEMLDVVSDTYLERVSNPMEKLGANLIFGPEGVQKLKMTVAGVVREEIHKVLPLSYKHMEEALDLRRTLTVRLQALPPAEFAETMKPVYRDDQAKLILLSAISGTVTGFALAFGVVVQVS